MSHISRKSKSGSCSILLWDKINRDSYLKVLDCELSKTLKPAECSTVDSLKSITDALNHATSKAVPTKKVKLQGPKFKLSPKVKALMKESKFCLFEWKQAGKPPNEHETSKKKKEASKSLRKQLRKEEAIRKQKFFSGIMSDPTDANFYKLIKRNQTQCVNNSDTCIRF